MPSDPTVIKEMGILSDVAYESMNIGYVIEKEGLNSSYTVLEVANYPSGMQAYLLKDTSTGKYVITFRGTEGDHTFLPRPC